MECLHYLLSNTSFRFNSIEINFCCILFIIYVFRAYAEFVGDGKDHSFLLSCPNINYIVYILYKFLWLRDKCFETYYILIFLIHADIFINYFLNTNQLIAIWYISFHSTNEKDMEVLSLVYAANHTQYSYFGPTDLMECAFSDLLN